jgi:ankyrin repeat protein
LLIDHCANIEHQDRNGQTVLLYAVTRNYFDVFSMLVGHGANIDHQDNDGQSALMYFCH